MSDSAPTVSSPASIAIARQAILDAQRMVFGYELFDRSVQADQHTASSDAQLLFNLLSMADNELLMDRKTLFINCTHDSLAGGHLELVAPDHIVLEIPPLSVSEVDQIKTRFPTLQTIHDRGFRLAFDYSVLTRSYEDWLPLASFIKFDLSVLKPQAVASFIKLARAKSSAVLIAEKVETAQQHEMLQELGITLFQGYWFAKPVLVEGQTIRPAQATILQLINLVRKQASTNEIEEVLKRDPTLSFNLLRFINSAGFGLRTEVTSFKHAVMLLGLKKLFKWAALLLTTSQAGDTPPAVGTTAVVRGRLMELLAGETLPADECDNAFVVGVFSLLDTLLGIPMPAALATLTLPESVTNALLYRTGPLAPYLLLTEACESGDDDAFAQTTTALGLSSNQVNWAHLQALAWAETLLE
ncbi:HDOD domain-containing protein [Rhodoferax saidenbachensis]|uniref:EAL and modified HD-GYP domain-containing signal transduction protein n=1 Tax=Rhodoferax saidenbachensis TaxID=1484693 RepID=A0ABU1ZQI3_9BURK|nr:HDOD domain-containing protein [Rhodoferax saidenbachensis]MDR7307813.1 EAL and modified HD-GYP domain-containing signal transduction protein [Rhodoferax saidenbachensis]